jgi:ubiquinone/menaquinone biosynthesis C-methylase UbiE
MPESRSNSLRHWETYYRGGALASCPLGTGSGCSGELRDVWVKFFSGLPAGARILDVGTGNGAIALIARECAEITGRGYVIHATDLARIDPVRDVPGGAGLFAGIRFHPQVATEDLPFADSSFEAISGQYALEYSNIEMALKEVHRVLSAGGSAQFILHHADSIVAHSARASLLQAALVLNETMILRKLRRYLNVESRSGLAARNALAELVDAGEVLRQAARQTRNPHVLDVAIDAVQKLLAARGQATVAEVSREVDRFEADVRASVRRLEDLVRCGLTESGMRETQLVAERQQLVVDECAKQFHAVTNLVGWRLRVRKR